MSFEKETPNPPTNQSFAWPLREREYLPLEEFREFLALRGGFELVPINPRETIMNYSAGVGLTIGGFTIDYAYYIDSLLYANSTHFISISYAAPDRTIETRPILPAQKPQRIALN